ncbi:MAG: hypothetical protein AB7S26_09615 [Sandaracinaceae bacterium]
MIDGLVIVAVGVVALAALRMRTHLGYGVVWALVTGLVAVGAQLGELGASELDRWLAVASIALLGPGMYGIRVILERSVSVAMLASDGMDPAAVSRRFASRIGELERTGLARRDASGTLSLTARGRAVARLVGLLYFLGGHTR